MPTEPLDRQTLFQELTPVFHSVFDNDRIQLVETLSAKDVKGWDSLNHINLIIAIEKKFKIKFRTAEVVRLANVGELVDLMQSKLASK